MYRIEIDDMDIEQIARSGQCFRMGKQAEEPGVWTVAAAEEYVEIMKEGNAFLFSCEEETFRKKWAGYFDLKTDYSVYKKSIDAGDSYLSDAAKYGWGVRILNQDLWEMIVTFLISQNNNIARITGSIDKLCQTLGEERKGAGFEKERIYYAFPKPEAIVRAGTEDLSRLGLGYRDKYVLEAAVKCSGTDGKAWLESLRKADYETAHRMLMGQYGIGRKVADCICLFGLHHVGAFPIDTHVRQILESYYPQGFPLERYKGYAGILQQYMFYYKVNKMKRDSRI